jgi:uncharacterized protein YndB with AHSA1/START domain
MTTVNVTAAVDIDAPAERIYPHISDFAKHSEWSKSPIAMTRESDGSYSSDTKLFGKAHHSHLVVTSDDMPRRFEFDVVEPDATVHHTFTLTPQGSGTRVERTMTLPEMHGVQAVLVKNVVAPLAIRSDIAASLKKLKRQLESA